MKEDFLSVSPLSQSNDFSALLIGGALANALAFTSSSYLFLRLYQDSNDAERQRHDLAIEKLQNNQIEWAQKRQQQIDFSNKQLRLEQKVEPNSQN